MFTIREYKRAESLEEAWTLNQKRNNMVIGGMIWAKTSGRSVNTAIDLSGLGLDAIGETAEGFSIGAMVTLRQLETHPGFNAYTGGAAREALRHIVGVQLRNSATVGGSIWGRFGFSDVLTLFLSMETWVELYKGGLMPVSEFAALPCDRDILVRLFVRRAPARYCYQSVRNTETDFPALTCAAALGEEGFRIAVGARPQRAVLLPDRDGILRPPFGPDAPERIAAYAAGAIPTGSNLRGSAEYRTHLVKTLTKRAVTQLLRREGD